ncbi:hypothetical protein DSO57_1034677 [Entomophthora muscae]|uniref:Uncharacterized protein n=1 Tax=Entomophthora muscae TaxID=34485 RepID=A0ACC2ULP0_9FUNG|nr:hypothetical protein DSO57_1034677 [Entomophthora muscae]
MNKRLPWLCRCPFQGPRSGRLACPYLPVRNIPDINQILSKEKCWNQADKCSTGGAKFDREFPPLSGEKKNQNSEKTDFYGNRNNLTSGQAPATLCQPPAQAGTSGPAASPPPASHQPPAHPPPPPADPPLAPRPSARFPGPCQLPVAHPVPRAHLPSQPKPTMKPSQSEKSLETRDKFKNNSCAQEEGQIHVSHNRSNSKNITEKPKITPGDKNNNTYSQWNQVAGNNQLGLDSNQTSIPKPKIEVFEPKSCHHHLATHPEEIIGPKQNCLKPQQIAQEQEFGYPFKHQTPIPMTKLLGTPVPCFHSHLQNFASGGPL